MLKDQSRAWSRYRALGGPRAQKFQEAPTFKFVQAQGVPRESASGNVPGIESEPADLHDQLRDELPFSAGPAPSATCFRHRTRRPTIGRCPRDVTSARPPPLTSYLGDTAHPLVRTLGSVPALRRRVIVVSGPRVLPRQRRAPGRLDLRQMAGRAGPPPPSWPPGMGRTERCCPASPTTLMGWAGPSERPPSAGEPGIQANRGTRTGAQTSG